MNKETETLENEKKEIIQEITKTQQLKKARAEGIRKIFEATKKWRGHETNLVKLKEPIMLFGRRNGTFELFEGVTTGNFEFKHSCGEPRFIIIDPNKQIRIGTGQQQIRAYWAHEDYPVSGWPDPVVTTEQMNIFADKLMNDVKNWLLKKQDLANQRWLYIGGAIAMVIIAVALFKVLSPPTVAQNIIYTTPQGINETIRNITTNIINNGSKILG